MALITRILPYIQIILSALLAGTILLQQSGAELGGALGGGDSTATYHTKRGFEKVLFIITIVLAILFAITAVLAIILNK
jgi:preprotein translocase subunit SecG